MTHPMIDDLNDVIGDARIIEHSRNKVRMTDIPYSATHMLPGGMATLEVLEIHWSDWQIEYVDNGKTIKYGKADKDVVIRRDA